MKLYIVVHENASGPKDSVDTKLYLTEDAAEEGIYRRFITARSNPTSWCR